MQFPFFKVLFIIRSFVFNHWLIFSIVAVSKKSALVASLIWSPLRCFYCEIIRQLQHALTMLHVNSLTLSSSSCSHTCASPFVSNASFANRQHSSCHQLTEGSRSSLRLETHTKSLNLYTNRMMKNHFMTSSSWPHSKFKSTWGRRLGHDKTFWHYGFALRLLCLAATDAASADTFIISTSSSNLLMKIDAESFHFLAERVSELHCSISSSIKS